MSTVSKNTLLLIVSVIISGGAFFVIGREPIAGLQLEISQIDTENLVLHSQIEQLIDSNNNFIERLENTTEELSETQSAFQTLYNNYNESLGALSSVQFDMQNILVSYEDLKTQLVGAQANNNYLIGLYSSVWKRYSDLIIAYNNLTSDDPVGQMIVTVISGIVNGDWENGNEGWSTQGVSNLVDGVKYLHKNDSGTFTGQSVYLTHKNQGLMFKVKPQPFGGEIYLEVSVGGVSLYSEQFTGQNAEWEEIVIPFRSLMQMREYYGFPIMDSYDIRFTVLAGEDTGANIALDDVTLIEIDYRPEEPSLYLIEYIRNGDFEEPIIYDPSWGIPEWNDVPSSGTGYIAYGGTSGRSGRAICPHPGKIIQELDLPATIATLTFWLLPQPNNDYSTINVYFDEELIFEETYSGSNDDFDWVQITFYLDIEQGTHYLTFEVLTENAVRIDDVSLVG